MVGYPDRVALSWSAIRVMGIWARVFFLTALLLTKYKMRHGNTVVLLIPLSLITEWRTKKLQKIQKVHFFFPFSVLIWKLKSISKKWKCLKFKMIIWANCPQNFTVSGQHYLFNILFGSLQSNYKSTYITRNVFCKRFIFMENLVFELFSIYSFNIVAVLDSEWELILFLMIQWLVGLLSNVIPAKKKL